MDLNFYGRGRSSSSSGMTSSSSSGDGDGSASVEKPTEEPTYFLYPTYSPVAIAKEKVKKTKKGTMDTQSENISYDSTPEKTLFPTYWPSYDPMAAIPIKAENRMNDSAVDQPSMPSPPSPSWSVDKSSKWTWAPTQSISEAEQGQNAKGGSDDDSSIYSKRICPGRPFGMLPVSPKKEVQVFFAYGIQIGEGKHGQRSIDESVELIQLWILKDLANGLLDCPKDRFASMTNDNRIDNFFII